MNRKRQSNLELLRILAMFFIVALHYSVYSDYPPFTSETVLSVTSPLLQFLGLFGRPACSIFAIISGYFLIGASRSGHYRKIVPLIAKRSFYAAVILASYCIFARTLPTKLQLFRCFLPHQGYNWYIQYYILFYLFVPFLNPFVRSLDRKRFFYLLLLLLTVWSVLPSIAVLDSDLSSEWRFGNLAFFIVMYLIGAFIRLHVQGRVSYPNSINLAVCLASVLINVLCVAGIDFIAHLRGVDGILDRYLNVYEFNFIFGVTFVVSIFLFFLNLNFSCAAINKIAHTTVGIYIIHEHPLVREIIWKQIWPVAACLDAPYLHALLKIPAVFLALMLIDMLRSATLGKWFGNWYVRSCYPRIDRFKAWAKRRIDSLLPL